MKIDIRNIPPEGLHKEASILPAELDPDTDVIRVTAPIAVKAHVFRICDVLDVKVNLATEIELRCGRCLNTCVRGMEKSFRCDFTVTDDDDEIDLLPYIREELILDYPIKPLCKDSCKGLCRKCGADLNKGGCSCGITKEKTL